MSIIPEPLIEYQSILDHDEFVLLVVDLIDTFLQDAPDHLDRLKIANRTGDNDAFKRASHTLKSSADTFGLLEFRHIAAELEARGSSANSEETKQLVTRLEIEYAKAKSILLALRESI